MGPDHPMNIMARPKAWASPPATARNGLRIRARSAGRCSANFTSSTTRCGRFRPGETGKLWFKTASPFEYFNDPVKTAEANSPDRTMSTVGDIGRVDEDGYVYLTDRAAFMIISGGVNIYPQECENLLVTHPKVADAAVFGVPERGDGRGGQGRRAADAGIRAWRGDGGRADRLLPRPSRAPRNARVRSTSKPSCRVCRPASSTRARCATAIGRAA